MTPPVSPRDLLINGRFSTLDSRTPEPEAMVVGDGRFLFTGARAEAAPFAGPTARIVVLGGRRVIPGLIDMHAHLDREGLKQLHPPMTGLRSRQDVLERIAD